MALFPKSGVQYLFDHGTSAFTEIALGNQFRMLLFGGQSHAADRADFTILRTTWSYYDELNSWRTVDNLSMRPSGAPICL